MQCLFKLDPPKMVKVHVMHIIINVKFYSVDMAKNLSKSWQATIRSIYVLLKLPCWFLISSFLDQTDFPLWKCQLLWNRNDLSFSKSSSLDVFWNFLCGIFNMYNVHWKYLLFVSRVASFGLPTLPVITTPSTNSLSGGGIGVLGLQQFFICFI